MTKRIILLGSTGSVGTQAVEVIEKLNMCAVALTAHSNAPLMERQARRLKPELVAMSDEAAAKDLRQRLRDTGIVVCAGAEGVLQAARCNADIALNSLLGIAGLQPTLAAIETGKDIALANKETLVTGGRLVMEAAARAGVSVLPVDSEHSAIFQCVRGDFRPVKKIVLTASGGPFLGFSDEQLRHVTARRALMHPTWDMGAKITIDSATLMNKGLELIEAAHLFGIPMDKLSAVIHRQSIVHSLVMFQDNSVMAQLAEPDMRLPIAYALAYPDCAPGIARELDFSRLSELTFEQPDYQRFECLELAVGAFKRGALAEVALNAANEVAVEAFLDGKCSFTDIPHIIRRALDLHRDVLNPHLCDIISSDAQTRAQVRKELSL